MTFLNDFVTRELDEMRKFLHYISVCGSGNSLKFVFRPWWWRNLLERQRSAAVYTKIGYICRIVTYLIKDWTWASRAHFP